MGPGFRRDDEVVGFRPTETKNNGRFRANHPFG
jgi:hypothetical protein